jgi:hypothetical protein
MMYLGKKVFFNHQFSTAPRSRNERIGKSRAKLAKTAKLRDQVFLGLRSGGLCVLGELGARDPTFSGRYGSRTIFAS